MFYKIENFKKFSLLILFFFLNCTLFLNQESAASEKENFCSHVDPVFFINQKIPTEIHIKTNNSKRWAKNIFSLALESNSESHKTNNKNQYNFQIPNKFKKKFKSEVKFIFKNPDYECVSNAEIRVRGNLWWHLIWKDGHPFTSLRVDLKNGHLNNITSFEYGIQKTIF